METAGDPAKSRLDWYKRDADGKLVQVMSKEAGQRHERYHDAEAGGR
ncbi:MAG: hypothetical protein ACLR8P_11355 [Clostridium fessum]